jgi:hypothetical protein
MKFIITILVSIYSLKTFIILVKAQCSIICKVNEIRDSVSYKRLIR